MSATRVEEQVSCVLCEPVKRWWSRHPRSSYRRHLRRCHPEEWEHMLKAEKNELLAAVDNATMMRVA